MSAVQPADLRAHLVASRLAGAVNTPPRSTLDNSRKLVRADPSYTFGLPDHLDATLVETVDAVRSFCGDPHDVLRRAALAGSWPDRGEPGAEQLDGDGYIDPDQAIRGIEHHRQVLAGFARTRGRVLFATGHPTGLVAHYGALARALAAAGCTVLQTLEDARLDISVEPWRSTHPRSIRFLDGVAVVRQGGDLLHSHRPDAMNAMLEDLESPPDLVVADHGLAGAAIARGIRTLSIADSNDPGLPLAQVRGRTDGVLCIDDNLSPRLFRPVTEAMLAW